MKECKNRYIYPYNAFPRLTIKEKHMNLVELYDYNNQFDVQLNKTRTKSGGYIIHNANSIKYTNAAPSPQSGSVPLSHLDCDTNAFFYCSSFEGKSLNEQSWLNLKKLTNSRNTSSYLLSQGDVLKLGRMRLKVRDISINDGRGTLKGFGANSSKKTLESDVHVFSSNCKTVADRAHDTLEHIKRRICRVCYSDELEIGSPLISPCKCLGGLKYIHFSCLQKWIKARAILHSSESSENCIVYHSNEMTCEICKEQYPDFFREGDALYAIFDIFFESKFKNYISLESMPKEASDNKTIYIIFFDNKTPITIGRGGDMDVRLAEITVSRFHARIVVNPDKSLLYQDLESKFGSLALIQNPRIKILPNLTLSVQIGHSLISFSMKMIMCCCGLFSELNETKVRMDYGELNKSWINYEKALVIKDINDHDKGKGNDDDSFKGKQEDIVQGTNKLSEMAEPSPKFLLLKSNVIVTDANFKVDFESIPKGKRDNPMRTVKYLKTNSCNINDKGKLSSHEMGTDHLLNRSILATWKATSLDNEESQFPSKKAHKGMTANPMANNKKDSNINQ